MTGARLAKALTLLALPVQLTRSKSSNCSLVLSATGLGIMLFDMNAIFTLGTSDGRMSTVLETVDISNSPLGGIFETISLMSIVEATPTTTLGCSMKSPIL